MRVAGIARLILAELPEGLALADAAAAVHALRHGLGDPFGGDQQRRQRRRDLLGPVAQRRRRGPARRQHTHCAIGDHRSGIAI